MCYRDESWVQCAPTQLVSILCQCTAPGLDLCHLSESLPNEEPKVHVSVQTCAGSDQYTAQIPVTPFPNDTHYRGHPSEQAHPGLPLLLAQVDLCPTKESFRGCQGT